MNTLQTAQSGSLHPICSAFTVKHGHGLKTTQLDIQDGIPYAAWSVLKDDSGRLRHKRIWTHGQRMSMRIMWVIAEWRKQN